MQPLGLQAFFETEQDTVCIARYPVQMMGLCSRIILAVSNLLRKQPSKKYVVDPVL
ncbi:MAG: hypothetical protein U0T81_12255 [Saprospiraceae bacterium]